jgi:hypothetical protein
MSMSEFVSRFAAKDEKGFLFEVLRRVSSLDRGVMLATTTATGWIEWPPIDDPSGPSLRVAEA